VRRVTGLPDDQVVAWESKLEAQVVASLQAVMDKIASRIEKIQVASGLSNVERRERVVTGRTLLGHNDSCSPDRPQWTLVAVATTGPTGDDDPPPMTGELAIPEPTPLPAVLPETPGLPPGQPYISPDDLASIAPLWQQAVAEQVLPLVAQVFIDSAGHVRSQFLEAVAPGVQLGLPGLGSVAAEAYLAQARNTYEQVGDHLWATARAQLSEGFDAGESIPQLAARLRQSAGLSARTAVMVARTSVIEASNAGSMAMARVSGITGMRKSWQATNDRRTRPAHLDAEARYEADPIPLNEPFIVGGYPADYPAADTLPPSMRYRCRCTTLYLMPDQQPAAQPQLPGTSAPPAITRTKDLEPGEEGPLTVLYPKTPGEPGFDLADFPEPPPVKVRSSLLRARTDRELIAAWQGEMRATTGRDIIVQLSPDASVLTMREHAEGVLQMLERFPEARLRKISWYDQGSTEYAHVKTGTATLEFNARWASTAQRRAYLAQLRHDVSGWDDATGPGYGWSVRGGRYPQATAWHEMAHILSIETLGGKLKAEAMRITLRRQVADALPDMESIVRRDVSGYATKNMEELIAEAVTDVMANGPRASLLSRELYDMVAREYRAKGFAVRTVDIPEGEAGFEAFTREAFPKGPDSAEPASLADLARLTPISRRPLEGGISAKVEEVTYPGGRRAVEKDYARPGDMDQRSAQIYAQRTTTAEALAADVLRVVGVRRPDVVRVNDTTILMDFVDGRQGGETGVLKAPAKVVASAEGRRLGLADALMGHRDRGGGNWMRAPDGGVVAIDNGGAFGSSEKAAAGNPFVSFLMGRYDESPWKTRIELPSDIDLAEIRRGLTALRSKFADAGYQRQFKEMMDRLTEIERRAVRVPPAPRLAPDVPAAAPPIPALQPTAARLATMKIGDLRALAKERGITVPAGTRKADLVRMLDEGAAPVPTPVGSAALPARVVAARAELARVVEGPVVRESYSVGGAGAKNRRTGYAGGDVIEKDYTRGTKAAGVRDADAEELGALVMDALDVPTQTVLRAGPQRVLVSVLEGEHPGDIGSLAPGAARRELADTDGGRLLGLGDVLIGNSDRRRNWVRLPDGRPASYDLGGAFRAPKLAAAADPEGLFAHHFATATGKAWAPNDMAPADLALIRTRLEALRPEFERLKRGTWFNQMMARLVEVEKRATGTRSRLAEAAGDVASPEARAVARQAVIDERRAVADSLGEVRELLANGASERALASRARLIAGRTTGAASEDLAGLVRAMESGDADRVRVALGDVAQRRGLTEVGPGGDVVPFDPKIHELVGGARRPPAGTFVQVQRPGYSVRLDDGEVVQLSKAKVDTLTAEEIAERTAVQERKALREAARERNRVIEAQRGTARLLAEVDELAAKGASKTAIRERLDPALREAGQAYAGADAAVVDTISAALDSGDTAKIRAAVTRAGTKAKIKPIGRAGAKTTFDPDTMEGVGGIDIAPGAKVTVVRRGSTVPGLTDPLAKAQVTPVQASSTAKTVEKGDFAGLMKVGEQKGSNPGALYEAGDGSRWYIKTARDSAQLRSEALALDLYRAAGLDVPDVVVGRGVDGLGSTQIASRFLGDATSDLRERLADEAYRRQLQEGFAADAWLGNWDVLGLGLDNVLTTAAGTPIRIEAGGALRFRAQGAAKAFGDEVGEFDTMREAGRGAGRAFAGMTPEQLIASAERIRKVTPTKIKALVKRNDLDPALADTLIARRVDILRRVEALAGPRPMTVRGYDAAIKSAAKGQDALSAAPIDAARGSRGENPPPIPGVTSSQQRALISYRGHGFGPINDDLRGLSPDEINKKWHGFVTRQQIEDSRADVVSIDGIFDHSRLVDDVVLWRGSGTGRSILGDPATWGDDLSGFTWRDEAYLSATASEAVAADFIRGLPGQSRLMLRLLVPKGSKAIKLSDLGQRDRDEAEMLLGRGATFRVVRDRGWSSITSPTGVTMPRVRTLDVEVVVPDETPPLPWDVAK
jgi:hypothetical protein